MDKVTPIYTAKQRRKLINAEFERLIRHFENVGAGRRATLEKLINEAAFMAITLEETRKTIENEGITERYQNGANQWGIKKSAAVEVYDKMVNTYSKVIAQLNRDLPDAAKIDPTTDLVKFLLQRPKMPHRNNA